MSKPATRKLTEENSRFSMSNPMQFSEVAADTPGAKAQRKFSGTAYSGDVIKDHWYWGDVVFDMSTMHVPPKLPALVDHDRSMRAGYVTESVKDPATGFKVSGMLLSNEHGTDVSRDSDEGFPWQMSIHIEPRSIEEFAAGESAVVNGRTFTGPLTVFRNSTIVEVSFTATGHDPNTAAVAMSRGGSANNPSTTGDPTMTPEEIAAMQAENAKLKADNATAAEAAAKFAKESRTAAVQLLFSDIGREFKADAADTVAFVDMPEASFAATATVMRSQFKKPAAPEGNQQPNNPALFSHTATSGAEGNGGAGTLPGMVDENAIVSDARKRAEQFAKAHGAPAQVRHQF